MFFLIFIFSINIYSQSIEEKIYQLIWSSFDIHQSTEIINYTKKGIGGIHLIWGSYTSKDTKELSKKIYQNSTLLPFIAIDYEGGSVYIHQTHGFLNIPSNMALAKVDDYQKIEKLFYLAGVDLKKVGINTVFAPTIDVNTEEQNPIINVRSFGNDKELVLKLSNAVIQGLNSAGVINVVKHFPGHGMSKTDPHHQITYTDIDAIKLYETHIYPFKKLIEQNKTFIVMLSHIIYKTIDPHMPASLSKNIIQILRDQLKFNGIIITDSMDMKAITKRYGVEDASVMAIKNGVDMILIGRYDVEKVKNKILDAAKKGEISMQRIEESFNRIADIKKRYITSKLIKDNEKLKDEYQKVAYEISKKSIKIIKGDIGNLKNKKIKLIFMIPARFSKEAVILYENLKKQNLDVDLYITNSNKIKTRYSNYDTLIIANYSWPEISKQKIKTIKEISKSFSRKIYINLLNPLDSEKFIEEFDCIIETYGINEYISQALTDILIENSK